MTALAPAGIRFHHGSLIIPAGAVHTTPLGYDRDSVPVGAPLPLAASAELVHRLSGCGEIVVAFEGKLGDTLLALSGSARSSIGCGCGRYAWPSGRWVRTRG